MGFAKSESIYMVLRTAGIYWKPRQFYRRITSPEINKTLPDLLGRGSVMLISWSESYFLNGYRWLLGCLAARWQCESTFLTLIIRSISIWRKDKCAYLIFSVELSMETMAYQTFLYAFLISWFYMLIRAWPRKVQTLNSTIDVVRLPLFSTCFWT